MEGSPNMRIFAVVSIAVLGLGCSDLPWQEPTAYTDCLLDSLGTEISEAAVTLVTIACREKFSEPDDPEERPLTLEEIRRLAGRAGQQIGGIFSGTAYNGSGTIAVTELLLSLEVIDDGEEVSRNYRTSVSVPPYSAASFSVTILSGDTVENPDWSILGARGYETEGGLLSFISFPSIEPAEEAGEAEDAGESPPE